LSLKEYKGKRDFKETAEPKGKLKSIDKQLIFVVQKHRATNLHYDFRLELNDVLKSWAIPKGPSMKPGEKRLAMMVEDHPFDYKDFEGIIPEGNYGAGEVIVWDNGVYAPIGATNSKKENEKIVNNALQKGDLKFVLAGKKLEGEFALVNMKKDRKSWLLFKKNDEYALDEDILKKDKSVISNNTIEKLQKLSKRKSNSRKI
jgi:bifunctional non-homologous end joining protein LigD